MIKRNRASPARPDAGKTLVFLHNRRLMRRTEPPAKQILTKIPQI
jgi:hypothetical protein